MLVASNLHDLFAISLNRQGLSLQLHPWKSVSIREFASSRRQNQSNLCAFFSVGIFSTYSHSGADLPELRLQFTRTVQRSFHWFTIYLSHRDVLVGGRSCAQPKIRIAHARPHLIYFPVRNFHAPLRYLYLKWFIIWFPATRSCVPNGFLCWSSMSLCVLMRWPGRAIEPFKLLGIHLDWVRAARISYRIAFEGVAVRSGINAGDDCLSINEIQQRVCNE